MDEIDNCLQILFAPHINDDVVLIYFNPCLVFRRRCLSFSVEGMATFFGRLFWYTHVQFPSNYMPVPLHKSQRKLQVLVGQGLCDLYTGCTRQKM
jgi:hypothetical protein